MSSRMKRIVPSGGAGSCLSPPTAITNRHLLPVYGRPRIYCPIQTLVNAGIDGWRTGAGAFDSPLRAANLAASATKRCAAAPNAVLEAATGA